MLALRRTEGQWIEITHKSGDKVRFRVYRIGEGEYRSVHMAFDDAARNFEIERPERTIRRPPDPCTAAVSSASPSPRV